MSRERDVVEEAFRKAGIEINGPNDWDIQVHDERLYKRLLKHASLGLGEAYMEKWWDAKRIDLFIEKVLRVQSNNLVTWPVILLTLKARLFNLQSKSGAREVIDAHYDLNNELYFSFLDPHHQYSCGYFKGTEDLNVAQEQKMDLICKKLQLKPGDRLLDIGCGWGGFAKFAAERYGCHVVGITISDEQVAYAKSHVAGPLVEIRKQDYRDLKGEKFNKIVSIGMMEHVGYKNYRAFLEVAHACLEDNGLFLLHTIGSNETAYTGEQWSDTYIFPNGMLPSIKQLGEASEGLFIMEDWHNFGLYYYETLRCWDANFQKNWNKIEHQYSEKFYRMFRYYFNSFAGSFKARHIQLWQIVFTKGKTDELYESIR